MATYFELLPLVGRNYKTKAEVLAAWNQGMDFLGDYQLGMKPVNINDIPKPCTVLLRYKASRSVVSVEVPGNAKAQVPTRKKYTPEEHARAAAKDLVGLGGEVSGADDGVPGW